MIHGYNKYEASLRCHLLGDDLLNQELMIYILLLISLSESPLWLDLKKLIKMIVRMIDKK